MVGLGITLFNQNIFQFKCTGFVRAVVDESKLDALAFVGVQVDVFRINKVPITAIFDFYRKFLPVFIGCFRNPYGHVVFQVVEITGTIIKSQGGSRSLRQVDSRRYQPTFGGIVYTVDVRCGFHVFVTVEGPHFATHFRRYVDVVNCKFTHTLCERFTEDGVSRLFRDITYLLSVKDGGSNGFHPGAAEVLLHGAIEHDFLA